MNIFLLKPLKTFQFFRFRKKWRKLNRHNFTTVKNIFSLEKVSVGKYTYGTIEIMFYGGIKEFVEIGNFCSIAPEVRFIAGGEHNYKTLSSYPFKVKLCNYTHEAGCKGKITVGDDVWIGFGSIILSGITIGQGSIIGAGSVVAKDVPPYSVFVGSDIIKTRFPIDIAKKLELFDYSSLSESEIISNIDLLYKDIDENFFLTKLYTTHLYNT